MPEVAQTDEEIAACFDVMSELRPHLRRDGFVALVRQMASEGYRLAYVRDGAEVVAVAGYRVSTNFFLGRHLYLDDLVTSSHRRSTGHGEELIRWLMQVAQENGCAVIDLESGTQRGRAHRFYFRHGFTIDSYHFSRRLDDA